MENIPQIYRMVESKGVEKGKLGKYKQRKAGIALFIQGVKNLGHKYHYR